MPEIRCLRHQCATCLDEIKAACSAQTAARPATEVSEIPAEIDRMDPEIGMMVLVVLRYLATTRPELTVNDLFWLFASGMPYSHHKYCLLSGERP